MKWDDRSTLFPDGSRLKAFVRSQHHDVCRAHACRETTGITTDHFSRSPDNFSFFFIFFHFLSFSFIFFHFLSFSFIFFLFLSFSFIFFDFLSFSCIFFHFLSFSFSFIFIFFVGCSKSDFLWASISLRFLLTVLIKNQFLGPSRVAPLWTLFSFFFLLVFSPVFFCLFLFSCCFNFFAFLHFSSFYSFFNFSFFFNFFILFF